MTYFDHLLMFTDRAAAIAALSPLGHTMPDGEAQVESWRSYVLPDQTVTIGGVAVPGYFVTLSLHERNAAIEALPDAACRVIANRDTQERVYVAAGITPEMLSAAVISPVWAGCSYFG